MVIMIIIIIMVIWHSTVFKYIKGYTKRVVLWFLMPTECQGNFFSYTTINKTVTHST